MKLSGTFLFREDWLDSLLSWMSGRWTFCATYSKYFGQKSGTVLSTVVTTHLYSSTARCCIIVPYLEWSNYFHPRPRADFHSFARHLPFSLPFLTFLFIHGAAHKSQETGLVSHHTLHSTMHHPGIPKTHTNSLVDHHHLPFPLKLIITAQRFLEGDRSKAK